MNVILPNGQRVTDIPDGMSQKEVLDTLAQSGYDVSEIQRSITKPVLGKEGFERSAQEAAADASPAQKFFSGVGASFDRAAYGLRNALPKAISEPIDRADAWLTGRPVLTDQAVSNTLQQDRALQKHTGGWGTAGEIAGETAITAPAMVGGARVAMPAVRAVLPQVAATATRAAGPAALPLALAELGGSSAGGAAAGAFMSPEDRLGGAEGGAIGGALGYGAGRVLSRVFGGGITPSPDAAELMQQGIRVPVHQAVPALRRTGDSLRRLPVAGHAMRGMEARAIQDYNRNLIRDATPPRPVTDEGGNILHWVADPITEVSDNTVNLLAGRFRQAYDAVYRGRRVPLDQVYDDEITHLLSSTDAYLPHLAPRVQGVVSRIRDTLARGTEGTPGMRPVVNSAGQTQMVPHTTPGHAAVSADAIKTAINETEDAITAAFREGNGELAGVLQRMRDSLNNLRARSLPPEVAASLADVDRAYARFKPFQEAHGMLGAQRAGMVTPRQVLSATKSGDRSAGKVGFERGNLPGQRQAVTADRVLSHELPDVGPGTADAAAVAAWLTSAKMAGGDLGAAALLGTPQGNRFLMGGYPWQALFRSGAARDSLISGGQIAGQEAGLQQRRQRKRED